MPALAGVALFAATAYQTEIARMAPPAGRESEARRRLAHGGRACSGCTKAPTRFGKDPGNDIVLPDGAAKAGVFELHDGKVTVKMDGATRELWPDSLDVAKVGRLSLFVIKRSRQVRHSAQGSG